MAEANLSSVMGRQYLCNCEEKDADKKLLMEIGGSVQ